MIALRNDQYYRLYYKALPEQVTLRLSYLLISNNLSLHVIINTNLSKRNFALKLNECCNTSLAVNWKAFVLELTH